MKFGMDVMPLVPSLKSHVFTSFKYVRCKDDEATIHYPLRMHDVIGRDDVIVLYASVLDDMCAQNVA
jgi:hypothetical protein